jgi:hypothetical protein
VQCRDDLSAITLRGGEARDWLLLPIPCAHAKYYEARRARNAPSSRLRFHPGGGYAEVGRGDRAQQFVHDVTTV